MATGALVISILALMASAAAAFYTRQYATVERDRRHDETAPKFRAVLDRVDDRLDGALQHCQLLLYLDSAVTLETVRVEILDSASIVWFVGERPHGQRAEGDGPLTAGGRLFWPVDVSATRMPVIRVKIDSAAAGRARPWTTVEPVELPPPIRPDVATQVW